MVRLSFEDFSNQSNLYFAVVCLSHSCRKKTAAEERLLCCSPRLKNPDINPNNHLHVFINSECFEQHFSISSTAFTITGTTFFAANASSFVSM